MLCTGFSIKEAICKWFSCKKFCENQQHDSEHLILSKYYLYGAPQTKNF